MTRSDVLITRTISAATPCVSHSASSCAIRLRAGGRAAARVARVLALLAARAHAAAERASPARGARREAPWSCAPRVQEERLAALEHRVLVAMRVDVGRRRVRSARAADEERLATMGSGRAMATRTF